MGNRLAKNRPSPQNEAEYIAAYLKQNPSAEKTTGMDVAAVTTRDGQKGHALMDESHNRSRDRAFHRVQGFISDDELKKDLPKKKKQ